MISSSLLVLVGQPASVCNLVGGIDHRQNQEAHRHLDLTMLSRDLCVGAEGFEEPQASFQVIKELLCASFLNTRNRQLSMGDPMEKVLRGPNVLARCNPLITALGQFPGEPFKQITTGATT